MAQIVLERLRRKFGDALLSTVSEQGDEVAVVQRERLLEIAQFLRDDPELQMNMPICCTAIDWYQKREPRFEVVYHLYSVRRKHRLCLKIPVGEGDPTCPSMTPIWRGMNWHERETWDMYGIRFTGHPNLKRILLYEEFIGHPLRKDYPIDKQQPLVKLNPVREVPTQRQPPADLLNRP